MGRPAFVMIAMDIKKIQTIFILVIVLFFIGCSSKAPQKPIPKELTKIHLDLFAARGFLGGSDYEHYTMNDGILWRECGALTPKKGEENVRNYPLKVQQKRLESLTPEAQYPLIEAIRALKQKASSQDISRLEKPQSVRSIKDGGLFDLQISEGSSSLSIITNVDAVSDPKSPVAESLKSLFEKVRGVGPVMCNWQTFFGIVRK